MLIHRTTRAVPDPAVHGKTPVFIIAEAGVNHNGDLGLAKRLIDHAAKAGADAVKFQTFQAEKLVSRYAPKAKYQAARTGSSESQLEMLRKLELPSNAYPQLMKYAASRGIAFLSTPFDERSVDLLDELDIPLFKIASGEITNLPFLEYVARKRKPVILSTGMSYLVEVQGAVRILRETACPQITLLHCTSNYPADAAMCNLRAMQTLRSTFNLPVGYSDHTEGIEIAIAAVALGASVLEKHFTLDKGLPGPDHQASLEPDEFRAMVQAIRHVEASLGDGVKRPMTSESEIRKVARRSLVAAVDLTAGTILKKAHLTAKRPGTGLPPSETSKVVGRRLVRDRSADDMIRRSDLS